MPAGIRRGQRPFPSAFAPIAVASSPAMTPAIASDPTRLRDASQKALAGGALTPAEALLLYRGLDQPSLGLLANDVRLRLNPQGAGGKLPVTYSGDRNLNPTNTCVPDACS